MMLGIVIPHYSQKDLLLRAVESVSSFPVFVVDDSEEGGVAIDGVTVIRTPGRQGFAYAANAGLAEVARRGIPLALVLNDDAFMRPGSVDNLQSAWLETDGAIAPVVHEPEGSVYGISVTRWGRIRLNHRPGDIEALSGACIMMRSEERFDLKYRHGFEDVDLCRRLRERGLAIRVIENSACEHQGGASVDRRSRAAQYAALSGHLRYVDGGLKGAVAIVLAVAQVLSEGGSKERLLGLKDAIRDHVRGHPAVE
jgi:GT2 family glycosyltransferase